MSQTNEDSALAIALTESFDVPSRDLQIRG